MTMRGNMVFIGGGNMAEALLHGILDSGHAEPCRTTVTDPREDRLAELKDRFGVHTSTDNAAAVKGADLVWLCVKPQQMDGVLASLAGLAPEALYVSIAAGVPTARMEKAMGGAVRVVRVMPNTPALVQAGAAGIAAGANATLEDVARVETLMTCVGKATVVDEEDLHAVTALSGSGPAYVFYLVEALLRAGEELGLDPLQARTLVVQTVCGAGKLLEESGQPAAELRQRVTSKGGTTAAALEMFERAGVGAGLTDGALAAARRSRELAGE